MCDHVGRDHLGPLSISGFVEAKFEAPNFEASKSPSMKTISPEAWFPHHGIPFMGFQAVCHLSSSELGELGTGKFDKNRVLKPYSIGKWPCIDTQKDTALGGWADHNLPYIVLASHGMNKHINILWSQLEPPPLLP